MTQVRLEPEQLRELFEKQDILDAWMADAGIGFLFEIAREQRIHPPSMVHICEIAAAIAQMQSEERALSTALIVGDPARIGRVLPESEIQLQRYDHIRRMRQVVITLAEMVDGLVLGFVLDQNGYLRGNPQARGASRRSGSLPGGGQRPLGPPIPPSRGDLAALRRDGLLRAERRSTGAGLLAGAPGRALPRQRQLVRGKPGPCRRHAPASGGGRQVRFCIWCSA